MKYGFVKVGVYVPTIKVFDVDYNLSVIKGGIDKAKLNNVEVLVFPKNVIFGDTVGDLKYFDTIGEQDERLKEIAKSTLQSKMAVFVSFVGKKEGRLISLIAYIYNGEVVKIFEEGEVLFKGNNDDDYTLSFGLTGSGKIKILSCADSEYSGRIQELKNDLCGFSHLNKCAVIYAGSNIGESTTDNVYSGYSAVFENGEVLSESKPFSEGLIVTEIDVKRLGFLDRKDNGVSVEPEKVEFYTESDFSLMRKYNKTPFISNNCSAEFIMEMQAQGLKKRIEHTHADKIVLGLSGGLDSTLAIIIAVKALSLLNKDSKDVLALTMPCFGTTSRTFENSVSLAKALKTTLKKIDIGKSVKRHLKDIGHREDVFDSAYENAQARERTQVLMDIANSCNGLVLGTGDLSELALGWATYNGDHMSNYGVNGSIPKTLVRYLVSSYANSQKGKLKAVLLDILDTPVSPELIPAENDKIKQKTEDIVGPYVLHDFFLYHIIKDGFTPLKTYFVAVQTFKEDFDKETVLKWLKIFIRRFFAQSFKRSCMPDGVKVTEISLSPRCGFKMPSDAVSSLWLKELDNV